MCGAAAKLAADGLRQQQRVCMHDLQQPEDDVAGIVKIRIHGGILAVGGKGILGQIVRAEAQEVDMRRDGLDREGRRRGFNHGPQPGQRSGPTFLTQADEAFPDHGDTLRQSHHGDQDAHVEIIRKPENRP